MMTLMVQEFITDPLAPKSNYFATDYAYSIIDKIRYQK
jgi:hypothetical protein